MILYWYEIYLIGLVVHLLVYYPIYKKTTIKEFLFYIRDFNFFNFTTSLLALLLVQSTFYYSGFFKISAAQFNHMIVGYILLHITWHIFSSHPLWQQKMNEWGDYIFDKLFK